MNLRMNIQLRQRGLSLIGFMFGVIVVALLAVLGMKVVPSIVEYTAIKKAIVKAKEAGTTPAEIKSSFDKQASSGYIESVTGKDLEFKSTGSGTEVSVAYQKKIELIGPASLVIDYAATTESSRPARKID
jgi:Tfp pilus assembly major pilin PilA